jgi:peptide deformylase
MDRNGETFELTGEGLLAKAICHEVDHLDGILYTDKVIKMLGEDEVE